MKILNNLQHKIMLFLVIGTIIFLGFTQPPLQYIGGVLFILSFAAPYIFDMLQKKLVQQDKLSESNLQNESRHVVSESQILDTHRQAVVVGDSAVYISSLPIDKGHELVESIHQLPTETEQTQVRLNDESLIKLEGPKGLTILKDYLSFQNRFPIRDPDPWALLSNQSPGINLENSLVLSDGIISYRQHIPGISQKRMFSQRKIVTGDISTSLGSQLRFKYMEPSLFFQRVEKETIRSKEIFKDPKGRSWRTKEQLLPRDSDEKIAIPIP